MQCIAIIEGHSSFELQQKLNAWNEARMKRAPGGHIQHVSHSSYQGPLVDGGVETSYTVAVTYTEPETRRV